jgi:hypothetical protein
VLRAYSERLFAQGFELLFRVRHRCRSDTATYYRDFLATRIPLNSGFFIFGKTMKRDQMLMEAILGQMLQASEPEVGASGIAQRLNVEAPVIRHHLHLLQDRGWVQELDSGAWRLTNAGHDYLEGTPEQGISLRSLG